MSDTPTYASLLTRLFSGTPEERAGVVAHLEANEADRTAVEHDVRYRLGETLPALRLIAADAVFRVYRDTAAAVEAVAGVIRTGDPAAAADAAGAIRPFGTTAVPLLELLARHAPDVFAAQTPEFHRWAAETAVRSGPDGLRSWTQMLCSETTTTALLVGLAAAAPEANYDLSPVADLVRRTLDSLETRAAAGTALWRVTWRVNRDWLAWVGVNPPGLDFAGLRELLLDVLAEHLGRRPDLAGLVRDALAAVAEGNPDAGARAVEKLVRLGSRGWGVLIPMLHPPKAGDPHQVPVGVREAIFRHAAGLRTVLPLVHHHAHAVIASAAADGSANVLIPPAARVLAELGPAAGMAVPDLLNLAARVPSLGMVVGATLPKLAPGFPNTPAAVVRALARIRGAAFFGADHLAAFEALARALAELDPDAAPALVEQTGTDPRVPDLLLQQPGWGDAAPEVRARHARVLADALANPRPEVRLRAAELLRHYRDELPAVWPSLVATLACADEKAAVAVLAHFRHLGPVAEAVTADLVALFREKNPAYAARAVVALWRLGRMPTVAPDLRASVEGNPENGWGWTVLRGVVDRTRFAHGLLADLGELFAASPGAVAAKVSALVNPPESDEEQQLSRLVPPPGGDPAAMVDWAGLNRAVGSEGVAGALLALALMCEYGSTGSQTQKIWLIKSVRELTRLGLYESKMAVERVMAALEQPGAPASERQRVVLDFFAHRPELPPEILAMLEHRLGWFRWAGLELADAWGLTPELARQLTEDRVWDTNPRVRARALRMLRG